MLAIVKQMQSMTVGDKKVMIFTLGYGHYQRLRLAAGT
jgi:hypothetical protein